MEQESIEKAVAFIETHLTEEWSLETLAREAGYSPYHFARLFRKATGRSVMEYVRDKRIDAAAERLRQGKTVMETTLSVGVRHPRGVYEGVWEPGRLSSQRLRRPHR